MRKIGVIYSGNESHYRTFHEPKFNQYITKLIYHPNFFRNSYRRLGCTHRAIPTKLQIITGECTKNSCIC